MASVTGFTADRMLEIENTTIVSGYVNTVGHLILVTRSNLEIDGGSVIGPAGAPGVTLDELDVYSQELQVHIDTSENAAKAYADSQDAVINDTIASEVAALNTAIEAVQVSADGKNTIYWSATEPTGGEYVVNDIWYDTGNDNKMYRWDGTTWVAEEFGVAALDPQISTDINNAKTDAQSALDQVNTLNTVTLPALQSELDSAETDISNNASAIGTAQSQINTLNVTTIPGLQGDIDTLQTDLANANTEIDAILPITETKIADDAVTTPKIISGAIVTDHMTANSISGDRITANTLDAAKIVAGSITTDRMTANTINGDRITANTLNASKIVAGSITTDRMTANTINGDRISTNTLNADRIVTGSITAAKMTAGTITAASGIIADAAIGTAKIVDLAVTNGKIADLAVTNAKIADATIQSAKISALDAGKITTGTLSASRIGADSITSTHIAANAITASELNAGAVTAGKVSAGAIDGMTITGALIQTTSTANRGLKLVSVDNGAYGSMIAYDSSGAPTFTLNGQTGEITIKGSITSGSTITGATITGGLIRTASSGTRIELVSGTSPLKFYSGASAETAPGAILTNNPGAANYTELIIMGGKTATVAEAPQMVFQCSDADSTSLIGIGADKVILSDTGGNFGFLRLDTSPTTASKLSSYIHSFEVYLYSTGAYPVIETNAARSTVRSPSNSNVNVNVEGTGIYLNSTGANGLISTAIFNTISVGTPVHINPTNQIVTRSSSGLKHKMDIRPLSSYLNEVGEIHGSDGSPYSAMASAAAFMGLMNDISDPEPTRGELKSSVLDIVPVIYKDRHEVERHMDDDPSWSAFPRDWIGYLAEDFIDAGWEELVTRDPDTGEPDYLHYDRVLPVVVLELNKVIKELKDRISVLENGVI